MINEPKCRARSCKHYRGIVGEEDQGQRPICAAFPDGIPDEIAYGNNLHLSPVAGDRGLMYEKGETELVRDTRLAREQRDAMNEQLQSLRSLI